MVTSSIIYIFSLAKKAIPLKKIKLLSAENCNNLEENAIFFFRIDAVAKNPLGHSKAERQAIQHQAAYFQHNLFETWSCILGLLGQNIFHAQVFIIFFDWLNIIAQDSQPRSPMILFRIFSLLPSNSIPTPSFVTVARIAACNVQENCVPFLGFLPEAEIANKADSELMM